MLPSTVEQADRLDAATDRLRCGQQLDARSTLAVLGHLIDLVEANQRDHASLVADVAHEARRVSEDQQTLSPKGRGDFHGQTIAVDVDGDALVADGGRGNDWQVAVIQQQAKALWLEVPRAGPVVAAQDL